MIKFPCEKCKNKHICKYLSQWVEFEKEAKLFPIPTFVTAMYDCKFFELIETDNKKREEVKNG